MDLSDEAVILSLKDGVYYSLNDVAARIWELVREPVSVRVVCATLAAEYEVDPARCEKETLELLHQLREWGLVEVGPVTATRSGSGDP